eukprot:485527_1
MNYAARKIKEANDLEYLIENLMFRMKDMKKYITGTRNKDELLSYSFSQMPQSTSIKHLTECLKGASRVIDSLSAAIKKDPSQRLKIERVQLESQNKALRIERIQLESQNKTLSKKLQTIHYEKELFTKERKHLDKQKQRLRERQYTWNQKVIELSQHIDTHYDKQPQPSTDISEQPKHETIPPNDVKPKHETHDIQQRNYRKFPTNKTHVTRYQNNSYYHQKQRHYYERHNTYSRPHYRERTRQYYQPHNTYYGYQGYQRTYYSKARYYERPIYYERPRY